MNQRIVHIIVLMLSLAVSCREQELLEPDVTPLTPVQIPDSAPLTLLDDQGKSIAVLPNTYGKYNLVVQTDGPWQLHSTHAFVQLERESGFGSDTLWVMVGRNWSETREVQLVLSTDSSVNDAPARRFNVSQQANRDLSAVRHKVSSSMGAGYSYFPTDRYTMGTGIQIFNLSQFESLQAGYQTTLISDDYYPSLQATYYTSDSLEELKSKLKVTLTAEIDLKMFTLNVEGGYSQSNVSNGSRTYAAQRLNSTMFSRELNYMNALALIKEQPDLRDRVFASGFRLLHDNLVAGINQTRDYSTRYQLCETFIKTVGPCFASKSLMGCSMDYWISVDKNENLNSMSIEALLKFKWESTFSINVNAEGSYVEQQKKLSEKTQANFDIRGGNVQDVSILTTGSSLSYEALQKWLLDVSPEKAVLVDMRLEPIYQLFTDPVTHEALRDYLNSKAQ